MSQRVSLSIAHFSREFKRSVGSTPWAYVMARRLMLAHQKLREGCSVSSVAYHCGFADQSHLSIPIRRSEEHTSDIQTLIRISYAVFCFENKIHLVYILQITKK